MFIILFLWFMAGVISLPITYGIAFAWYRKMSGHNHTSRKEDVVYTVRSCFWFFFTGPFSIPLMYMLADNCKYGLKWIDKKNV